MNTKTGIVLNFQFMAALAILPIILIGPLGDMLARQMVKVMGT